MIVGTGVDLAEVPRVRHLVERYGRRFIERVYTPSRSLTWSAKRTASSALRRGLRPRKRA